MRGALRRLLASAVAAAGVAVAQEPAPPPGAATRPVPEDAEADALIARLRATVGARPSDPAAQTDLALALYFNRRIAEAETAFARAAELLPRDPRPRAWRGYCLLLLGDVDAAYAVFDACVTAFPDASPEARHERGRLRRIRGDLAGAAEDFARVRALRPEDPAGFVGGAGVALDARDDALALRLAEQAEALDPGAPDVAFLKAAALKRLGRDAEAAGILPAARGVRERRVADAWTRRERELTRSVGARMLEAAELLARGRGDEAIARLEALRAAHPDKHEIAANLAAAYVEAGRLDAARALLATLLAARPADVAAHRTLALLRLAAGDGDGALAAADDAVRHGPEVAAAHAVRGRVLYALKRPSEAVAAFEAAVRLDLGDADHRLALAAALRAAGRQAEAVAPAEAATRLAPRRVEAWKALAEARGLAGDAEGARAAADAAASLEIEIHGARRRAPPMR
ncbi:MAG TPA: tetratricopeptide repeat protein [Planctomycetota bacterium]|nr:tetratricopeptide repeat protein [Planctomycetota bacterium]